MFWQVSFWILVGILVLPLPTRALLMVYNPVAPRPIRKCPSSATAWLTPNPLP
jgi:hypothetical protein